MVEKKVGRGPRREGRFLSWIIQALIRATKAPWWIAAWLRCLSFVWGHTYTFHVPYATWWLVYVRQQPLTRPWNIHIGAQTSRRPDLFPTIRYVSPFSIHPPPPTLHFIAVSRCVFFFICSTWVDGEGEGSRLESVSGRCEPGLWYFRDDMSGTSKREREREISSTKLGYFNFEKRGWEKILS